MSVIESLGSMFASFWEAYLLPHPVLGISFGAILIGVFVVTFALRILVPLLGIGSRGTNVIGSALSKRARSNSRRKSVKDDDS